MILERLQQKGYPVLNLEEMASHRGSIFGRIGMTGRHNQKMFESLLWDQIVKFRDEPLVFVEAESKRIGQVYLPPVILHMKEIGLHVMVEAPLRVQVDRIVEEYMRANQTKEPFLEAFSKISKRLPPEVQSVISEALHKGNERIAVEQLMLHYYNPRYKHAREQYADKIDETVMAEDLEKAVERLETLYVTWKGQQ